MGGMRRRAVAAVLGVVAAAATSATGQTLSLDLNRAAYRAGDRLELSATTTAGEAGTAVDVYIGFIVPGGGSFYLTGALDLASMPEPVAEALELPDFQGPVLSLELPQLPAGRYSAFGFLTAPDAGVGAAFSESAVDFSFGTVSFDRFVTLGDSLTHATMEAQFNLLTQPFGFAPLVAAAMKAPFPLPLVDLDGRRIDPAVITPNLGVNGADTGDVLRTRSDAVSAEQIDSAEDSVFFPRIGSQIELAEQLDPTFVLLWIGTNDVLGAILAVGELDASQLTPLAEVERDYDAITARLAATGATVAVANIPDVTSIAFVSDGARFGLPPGSLVPTVLALLADRALISPFVLLLPEFNLSPTEANLIQSRIDGINAIIAATAARHGFVLLDTHGRYQQAAQSGEQVGPYALTTEFFGGIFSLDGVHPGYTGAALTANFIIERLNATLGTALPAVDIEAVAEIDPSVDHDGDGFVTGLGFARALLIQFGIDPDLFLDPDDNDPSVP
jgi:lysophospholipase L1-like esterase